MTALKLVLFFFLLTLLLVDSLYFLLEESQEKCFYEDLPSNVMVTGSYNLLLYDEQNHLYLPANHYGVHVTTIDPDHVVTMSKTYSSQGRFVFTTEKEGEHKICISSNSTLWYGGPEMKVHLELRTGSHDFNSVAHKETLTEMQMRLALLLQQMEMIGKEQEYQRHREMAFRQVSEHTSLTVLTFSLLIPSIVIIIRILQSSHLKSFFITKKLV